MILDQTWVPVHYKLIHPPTHDIGSNLGASALEIDSSSHTDYIGSHLGASALQIDPSSHTDDIGSNLGASALQTDSSSHTMTTLDQTWVPVHCKLIHPPTQ